MRAALASFLTSSLLLAARPAWADGPVWPDLATAPGGLAPSGDKDAAVIVALEEYLFLPKVPGAARNAADWYAFLVDARKIPDDRVHMLRDKSATREAILDAVKKARDEAKPGGTLWFVFIGHGAASPDATDGLLVGSDAQQTASGVSSRGVAQSELARELDPQSGVHSVALIDACFSGRTGTGAAVAQGLQPLIVLKDNPGRLGKVTWMTAGASSEFAGPLPGVDRPAFSYLVLGALRGWGDSNGDGRVTVKEAVSYARRTLNVLPLGRSQTPELHGSEPDLPLSEGAREVGPRVRDFFPPVETKPLAPRVVQRPLDAKEREQLASARVQRRAGIGLTASGLLVGGAGGLLIGLAAPTNGNIRAGGYATGADIQAAASRGKGLEIGGIVGLAVSGVALAVGIPLWASGQSDINQMERDARAVTGRRWGQIRF
jgi:hypothetical protein